MTIFQRLKHMYPELDHITFDGMDLEMVFKRESGAMEPFGIDEFKMGSKTWNLMNQLEEAVADEEEEPNAVHSV